MAHKTKSPDWYSVVAPGAYGAFYRSVLCALEEQGAALVDFPDLPTDLTKEQRLVVKYHMKTWQKVMPSEVASAYQALSSVVSVASADCWRTALTGATDTARMSMLAQMLRVSGTTYWLLGHASSKPVRHKVVSASTLRDAYRLKAFHVIDRPGGGQPRVDWQAVLEPKKSAPSWAGQRTVEGVCEIRWSHQKLQGNPECKVQIKTPIVELPGYLAL